MHRSVLFISFFLMMYIVTGQNQRPELSVEHRFDIPGSSIRAIEVANDSTLWFAGSEGIYGQIEKGILSIDTLVYENTRPHFRALATNRTEVYALSIENPALLFLLKESSELGKIEANLVYKEEHPNVFYDSMTFFDASDGIAMGDPVDGCLSILLTSDGGKNWQKIPCSKLPETKKGEAAFAASNTNIAVYGNKVWIATGGIRSRIWMSENKGKNWQIFDTPLQEGSSMTGIFSVDFYNETIGVIMGGNWEDKKDNFGSKALSLDGGRTWKLMSEGAVPGYISCVQFIPDSAGKELMAVSTEGIYYSSDMGNRWVKLSGDGFYSIRFVNAKEAWMSRHEEIVKYNLVR